MYDMLTRKATNKLLELVEDGVLDEKAVLLACLTYMSEDDVADMARINDLLYDDSDDVDNEEE